jgi:SIR2-like domain
MRITLLLGSGSSLKAGMPSTNEITNKVRSGEGIMRHPDSVYHFTLNAHPDRQVLLLTNALFSEIESYYNDRQSHPVNYENCCYLATQLRDAESGEFDNPAVQPLIEKLTQKEELRTLMSTPEDRHRLFEETDNYIRDVVWGMLKRAPVSVQYLGWLDDMVCDKSFASIDLVTLNHDTVLEQAFTSNSVTFCDGFGEAVDGVRFWQADRLQNANRIRLIKLHGSIDWFRFRSYNAVGIPEEHDPYLTDPRPQLLVGTFNKLMEYTTGIFADLHCHFHRCLRQSRFLVCCGYGFGDKGINTKLSEWINAGPDRRLIVVHASPDELFCCSRGAIANHWQSWQGKGKLVLVKKWMEDVSLDEIKQALLP